MLTWRTYRARHAILTRTRPPDDPDLLAAERDLTMCQLDRYARKAVGPNSLTKDQIDAVVAILTTSKRSDHAAA